MTTRTRWTLSLSSWQLTWTPSGVTAPKKQVIEGSTAVNTVLRTRSTVKAGLFSFEAFITNRSNIILNDEEAQKFLWDNYDGTKTYFFRVPDLSSEDKQWLRRYLNNDKKIRINIKENNWSFTMILWQWRLPKSYEVCIESKSKKKNKKSTN